MSRLRFTKQTVSDTQAALEWYETRSAIVANRFRAALDGALSDIEEAPNSFPLAFPEFDVRFHRLRRYPYLVLYRANDAAILIIGVLHGASNPQTWIKRIQS